jgi:hypothetical protein
LTTLNALVAKDKAVREGTKEKRIILKQFTTKYATALNSSDKIALMVVAQEQSRLKSLKKAELLDYCKKKGVVGEHVEYKQHTMAELLPLALKYTDDQIQVLIRKSEDRIARFAPPEIASQFLALGEIEPPAQEINAQQEPIESAGQLPLGGPKMELMDPSAFQFTSFQFDYVPFEE